MKKTLVSALTTALVVGAASTTFAASNPFSDVPADHWAYDAVSQLAADGVIDGYGDSTFKGNRNITRYEMAQMVAKAMAKNTSGADKALVDKLAAEFAAELNNLGVRVANLERNADMVKWNGTAEYTFTRKGAIADDAESTSTNNFLFRLEPSAEVNSNWHVKARLDANVNAKNDEGGEDEGKVALKRIWAEGKYNNFTVKLGKFATPDDDTIADTAYSGAEVSYAQPQGFNAVIGFGRLKTKDNAAGVLNGSRTYDNGDPVDNMSATYGYVGFGYNKSKFDGAVRYHHIAGEGFKLYGNNNDKAAIWLGKATYRFTKDWAVKGFYAYNQKADNYKKAASLEVDYRGAQAENKGTWGAWVAYRHFGKNAFVANPWDVIVPNAAGGQKGWEIGANYTVFKNTVLTFRYGRGKQLNNDKTVNNIFGRVNFFF